MAGIINYPPHAYVIPRIIGTLSLLGSSYIIYDVVKRKSLAKVHHQILFGMSLADMGRLPATRGRRGLSGVWDNVVVYGARLFLTDRFIGDCL
jgi:hypothetical protein